MENIKTNYKVVENVEKNGIELYFDSIPTAEERQELKDNGYKWNRQKLCWYKKKGDTVSAKSITQKTFTQFDVVNTYDKFAEYFLKINSYINKYSEQEKEKTLQYFYKKYLLLITNDGYILELERGSTIDKTIYYDDETEAPKITENYFIEHNKSYHLPYGYINEYLKECERLKQNGCASGLYDYKGIKLTNYESNPHQAYFNIYNETKDTKLNIIRYLSAEEQNELLQIIEDLQNKYIERVKRYYARYSKHIRTHGYWVNR